MTLPSSLRFLPILVASGGFTLLNGITLNAQTPESPTLQAISTRPLTLGDAIRFAVQNNASAQSARVRTDAAHAQVRQQRSELLPHISAIGQQGARTFNTASFGIDFPNQPGQPPVFDPNGERRGPVRNVDYRGRLTQTIVDFGAIARVRSAQSFASLSEANANAVAERAGTEAALAYIRALRAEDDLRARNADSVLAADLLHIAEQQLNAGVGIALDVTRAQAQLAATRAQLIASRNARDRAKIELLRALGLPLDTQIALSDSLASTDISSLDTIEAVAVERALHDRPDLRAAEQRISTSQRALSAIRAERLPSLSFFGDQGVQGKNYDYLLNTYTYGFQVSLPIFDGFRREARIQEQQAALREADIQRRDLRQQVAADIRMALLDLVSAQEQVAATRERARLAEQEVAQANERFRAGVAGNADVITASLSLTAARTAVIDALTNYQNARVALAFAQGALTKLP
jgi:outer membrane protein